jgi:hypothetical protein
MYIRVINNQAVWPYTLDDLRKSMPNVSFPHPTTDELLAKYDVFPVTIDPKPPVAYNEEATRQDPVLEGGVWVQHWAIVTASTKVAEDQYVAQVANIRDKRNSKLQECDWTQAKDIDDSVSVLWQPYRQELRDVTEQSGFPFAVVWPQEPV